MHLRKTIFSSLFFLTFWSLFFFPISHAESDFGPILQDPAPEKITRGNHYIVSNENEPYLFKENLTDVGGIFVGVGADQIYLMAGWAKPEILIPMDFDIYIVNLHRIYRLLFLQAENPDDFLSLWDPKKKPDVQKLIKENYPEDEKKLIKLFNWGQPSIFRRLKRVKRIHEKKGIPTFLSDTPMYDHLRKLYQNGNVYPVRGDLTQSITMKSISAAAEKAQIPVRVIYMSNAEQYFQYSDQYKQNFQGMYIDKNSLILRTLPAKKFYRYYIQKASDFNEWLSDDATKNIWRLVRYRKPLDPKNPNHAYVVGKPPVKKPAKKTK